MRRLDPMAAVTATVAADAEATGLAVLIAADAAVDVAEIAADAAVSRVEIAVDVEATGAHVKTAVAADLAGESVVSTANADQAHHLDRFRT
jgi:hypothetical protein